MLSPARPVPFPSVDSVTLTVPALATTKVRVVAPPAASRLANVSVTGDVVVDGDVVVELSLQPAADRASNRNRVEAPVALMSGVHDTDDEQDVSGQYARIRQVDAVDVVLGTACRELCSQPW